MADFSRASGNSLKDNTIIVVLRENCIDKNNNYHANVMVDNSSFTNADIKAGKGQADPNLRSRKYESVNEKTGETEIKTAHDIRFTESQIKKMKDVAGDKNTLTTKDKNGKDVTFLRLDADLMIKEENAKDLKGQTVMGEDGKPKHSKFVMPDTTTLRPASGTLTQNRVNKHFANTSKINEVQKSMAAKSKAANLEASASMAPSVEQSVPEIENEPLPL